MIDSRDGIFCSCTFSLNQRAAQRTLVKNKSGGKGSVVVKKDALGILRLC